MTYDMHTIQYSKHGIVNNKNMSVMIVIAIKQMSFGNDSSGVL